MTITSLESEEEAPPPKKTPVKAKAAPAKKEESSEEDDEEDGKHSFLGSMNSWEHQDVKHLQGGFKINVMGARIPLNTSYPSISWHTRGCSVLLYVCLEVE